MGRNILNDKKMENSWFQHRALTGHLSSFSENLDRISKYTYCIYKEHLLSEGDWIQFWPPMTASGSEKVLLLVYSSTKRIWNLCNSKYFLLVWDEGSFHGRVGHSFPIVFIVEVAAPDVQSHCWRLDYK